LVRKIVDLGGIGRRYQRLYRSHPERRLALPKESATLSAHSDVLWRASFRGETAIVSLSEYRRVNILCECQIVRHNGIVIASNDILARCLRIGRVEEARVELEYFTEVVYRLSIILLLFGQFCSSVERNCILIIRLDLHADLALDLVNLSQGK